VTVPWGRRAVSGAQERYDRQVRIFGAQAQRRLGGLTAAVVGVGGAGSLMVQGLAHLGVGRLLLVDPDVVETSNLARLVGAHPRDARRARPKVAVARRTARAIRPGLPVTAIRGSILDPAIWGTLRHADVLVGAVDGHAARWALNRLAVQYAVLYLDLAADLTRCRPSANQDQDAPSPQRDLPVDGPGVVAAGGRVAIVRPGGPCLLCQDGYDPVLAAREQDPALRSARLASGYDAAMPGEPAGAALFLNQAVTAQALAELLNLLSPWRGTADQILVDLTAPATSSLHADTNPACPVCGDQAALRGTGDLAGPPPTRPARPPAKDTPRAPRLAPPSNPTRI